MGYLQNISHSSQTDNIGGIISLQIFRAADVASMGLPVDGEIFGDIILKPGKASVIWEATFESNRLTSKSNPSREGASRSNNVQFTLPKDRSALKNQLEIAETDEFIILYTDSNGAKIIFGLPYLPVRFSYDHDSGGAISNLNKYVCQFYFNGPDNRYHYNGSSPAPIPGAAPSVVKYNGVAIASLQAGEVLNISSEFGFTNFYVST